MQGKSALVPEVAQGAKMDASQPEMHPTVAKDLLPAEIDHGNRSAIEADCRLCRRTWQ